MFYMFALFMQNSTATIMSPLDFLADPLLLLRACYRHKFVYFVLLSILFYFISVNLILFHFLSFILFDFI